MGISQMIDGLMKSTRRGWMWLLLAAVAATPAWAQTAKPSAGSDAPASAKAEPEANVDERAAAGDDRYIEQPSAGSRIEELMRNIDPSFFDLTGVDIEVEEVGGEIILRGPEEAVMAVQTLLEMLDESVERKIVEVVTVTQKDANEIARTVEPAVNGALNLPRSEDEVSVTALSTNILLVSALPQHMDFVIELIYKVDDVKSEIGKVELLRFQVRFRKAADVAEELREMLTQLRQSQGISGAEGELQIMPNAADNSIAIMAPDSEREKIQALLDVIDVEATAGWSEMKLTLFPLYHSRANEMASVITDLLSSPDNRTAAEEVARRLIISKATQNGIVDLPPINLEKQVRVTAHEGTNSLWVATPEENVQPMGELIRLMDDVPLAMDVDVRLFPLKNAEAETVRATLNEMFDSGEQLVEDPDGSGAGGVPEGETGKSLVYNIGIAADVRTNTLVVSGRQTQLDFVSGIVTELDRDIDQKVLKVVQVFRRDADQLATDVGDALRDVLKSSATPEELEVDLKAISSNTLLVSALPKDIDYVLDVIRQVDGVTGQLPGLELLGFQVQHRKAFDVAEELRQTLIDLRERQGISGTEGELLIRSNNADNRVTVIAQENERATIQKLIDVIDVEPVSGYGEVKLTMFKLMHSQANTLADAINDLLTSETDSDAAEEVIYRLALSRPGQGVTELAPIDLEKPLRIIGHEGSNTLIVATVEQNIAGIGDLIRLMDDVPMASDVDVKLFPLKFADADDLQTVLSEMFDAGKVAVEDPSGNGADGVPAGVDGIAVVHNIGLSADTRTNTLIVTGRLEQLALVDRIVTNLDQPATALKFPLRLIKLAHSDATRIGQIITSLFEQRFEAAQATGANQAALERERLFLTVDVRTNTLIVSASEENVPEITRIAQQLDTIPAQSFDQIRIITLQRLSAADLAQKINDLWQRKADLRVEAEQLADAPVIVVDERSNALVIASSVEDFAEIKRLVESLESQPMMDDTRLYQLEYADATVLTTMLDELFAGMEGDSESFRAPTIIPDRRSNALVVAATRDSMERLSELIDRLDVEAGPTTAIFKVYPLAHGSAGKLALRMQELFDSRAQGQDTAGTPIVILPDESSNAIVCSASRDDHVVIVDLLGMLDRPSNLARQFEIFPLRLARAASVADRLGTLFQSDASGGRVDAIAIEADERTNSVIVWASPSEMENVGSVISKLDTSSPAVERTIKVIQLKQALAEDFATLLEETLVGDNAGSDDEQALIVSFMENLPNGKTAMRRLLRQDITLRPDPRTNSLMVMAPTDSMEMLEAMIRDFDRIRPIRSEVRLFPLINSDAETMVDQLADLFSPDAAEGETRRQLVLGDDSGELEYASVGQELTFTADPRTNTLIAAGAEVDLRMVEELVAYLDSQQAEDRVVSVYQAVFRDAEELASTVQAFNQQEQQVLSESDDEMAMMRRLERQVSIESIGTEDEGSSKLIIGASTRSYQQTMDMLRELDRPEPQVMISVLIAEVTRTNNMELGIEIAGQDLHFSEDAILGPNGIIQGSDFDFISGTDLGAAGLGLGGFNFTLTGEDFSFLFHALQQDSRLEILSRPVLMVRNGEEGSMTIADQIPIVTNSNVSDSGQTNSTVGREDVGIILTTTPHISPDGYVTIQLHQEISNFSGETLQLNEGVSAPVISDRTVDTNVTVRDGETVVIGGLITKRESEGINKVPFFGDIPWFGELFKSRSISKTETELLVVLTVDVLRTDEDVRRIAREQRDKYSLPDSVLKSPLMEGLRILPKDGSLGPMEDPINPRGTSPKERPRQRDLYGPRPKTYGPSIPRPITTSTASSRVYGPTISRDPVLVAP